MSCIVCGELKTDTDHIRPRGAGGKDTDQNTWNLCRLHHIEKHSLGLKRFVLLHPKLKFELEKRGWYFDEYLKKWRTNSK